MKTYLLFRIALFAFIFSGALACTNSYIKAKPVASASDFPDAIEQAKQDNRYFVLHSGINVYTITSFQIDKAKQSLTVHLDELDSLHIVPVQNTESRRTRPRKSAAVNEIHLYTKDSISYTLDEPHTIPLDKVANIDLLGKG